MKVKNAYLLSNHAEKLSALLYFLLLLLLPTQLGKHYWPEYSLISGFRVDYLSPTIYLTDILIILLFILFLKEQKTFSLSKLLPYLFTVGILACSIIFSTTPLAGLYMLIKVAELLFFAYFTSNLLKITKIFHTSLYVLSVTVVMQSLLAVCQFVSKGYIGGLMYFLGERAITSNTPGAAITAVNGEIILRSYGTFSHPNVLAGYLVIVMTLLLLQRKLFSGKLSQQLLFVTMGVGTIGLLTTFSRIPITLWLSILVILLIYTLKNNSRSLPRRVYIWGSVGIGLLLSAVSSLVWQILSRFQSTSFLEESFIVRADLNHIALWVIQENPLLGVGLGNFYFSSVSLKHAADPLFTAVQPVHNIFLLVTAETGIVGLLLFLYLLFLAFYKGSQEGRLVLLLVLLLGMTDHYFLTIQQGQLLFAFVIGYCFSGIRFARG